jgi:hypothetical protein
VSVVTWRATFAASSDTAEQEELPSSVRAELERDATDRIRPPVAAITDPEIGDVPDPDPDEEDAAPTVYLRLRGLEPLPERERISTNELVPKQERHARFYMPREPRIVRLPP